MRARIFKDESGPAEESGMFSAGHDNTRGKKVKKSLNPDQHLFSFRAGIRYPGIAPGLTVKRKIATSTERRRDAGHPVAAPTAPP